MTKKETSESDKLRKELLDWADRLKVLENDKVFAPVAASMHSIWHGDLTKYWNLCLLSRSEKKYPSLSQEARKRVFRVRSSLERSMIKSLHIALDSGKINLRDLFTSNIFSESIKQGLSLRMPLSSCNPTKNCHWSCYAHDGMDAGRYPVIKGAINGFIAELFEYGEEKTQVQVKSFLKEKANLGIRKALREQEKSPFKRDARIRFSHVGEITAFPKFANEFASIISSLSNGEVRCVLYTRHQNASLLNPDLFIINFTLDRDSDERIEWVPKTAKTVFSAWDGVCDETATINFLEHHRFSHLPGTGKGKICPVTEINTAVKTCDSALCDLCFRNP
jgi:hypothetical protein